MISVSLREEVRSDFDEIRTLLINAFEGFEEANLVEKIRTSEFYIPELSIVALHKKKIVGHILFSKINITNGDSSVPSLALAPVSVLKKFQGSGVGSKLIMKGLEKAPLLGFKSVILLGHADYYPRFGFEPTTIWEVKPPFDVPAENFMGLELVPKGLDIKNGMVKYPDIWGL
ncbi:MAG: N-acetyltransferase [Balneola sp.]